MKDPRQLKVHERAQLSADWIHYIPQTCDLCLFLIGTEVRAVLYEHIVAIHLGVL